MDYGGRVEDLRLKSQSGGQLRTVLLTHKGNDTAIIQNAGWMGMLLIPWANRIAYVSGKCMCMFLKRSLHELSKPLGLIVGISMQLTEYCEGGTSLIVHVDACGKRLNTHRVTCT